MEKKNTNVFRKCKRKLQSACIEHGRNKKYLLQTELYLEQMEEHLGKTSCLFITHDNDGGTRTFENRNKYKYAPVAVLRRLRYAYMEDSFFRIEIYVRDEEIHYLIRLEDLNRIFQHKYQMIIVNSLVTFQCYRTILDLLIGYKKTYSNCIIQYFVHDFHAVCPNENLCNNECYCYLKCSENNCELYNGNNLVYIQDWRNIWRIFLNGVDEIRCFSESSKVILQNAYPMIDNKKITVKPHDTSYCTYSPITNMDNLPLCVGIVGTITTDVKGKSVVSKIIRCYGHEIPIRIIGTKAWRYCIFRKKVKYLGPYKRDELREILIREKVTFVVFPSLWPETFSYLISELMAMEIPIVCFNYGAQAEKVSKYHKGIVCANVDEMCTVIEKYKKKGGYVEN